MEVLVQDAVVCVVREKMAFWGVVIYIDDEANQPRYRIKGVPWGDTVDFQVCGVKFQSPPNNRIGILFNIYTNLAKSTGHRPRPTWFIDPLQSHDDESSRRILVRSI